MTRISAIACLIAFTGIFAACTEEEEMLPSSLEINEEVKSAAGEEFETAAKKSYDNSLNTEVTGSIDGRDFRGKLLVTEFIEESGNVYALANLVDTKIKGKDHKKLEYILELETYSIPVNSISGEASAESDQITISQTCTILNLEFGEISVDLLGLGVTIDPSNIVIDASDNEVLGNLICTVLDTLNNVIGLVDLLNQILGLLSL